MKTDNIYNLLNDYLKRSNKDSTNEVICRFLLDHMTEVSEMSVNEIADACYTSHPSVIRFTRELGFDGFADFKYEVQNYIDEVNAGILRISFPVDTQHTDEDFEKSLNEWMEIQKQHIVSSLVGTDREKIIELCKQIHDHRKVVLAGGGLSQVILELFRIELARCGKVVTNIGTDFEAIGAYEKEETMVVLLSMNGLILNYFKRDDRHRDLSKIISDNAESSWLLTMKKDLVRVPTNEMIVIESEKGSFDVDLNTAIVFFEMIGNCYQEMFSE